MTSNSKTFQNANIYHSHHGLQQKDAFNTLGQYMDRLNWAEYVNVLDIGCGPGDLTANFILPLLPSEKGILVGVDLSASMISYARSKYQDKRLKYEVMDITNANHIKRFENQFDIIFSFNCLHWVHEQTIAWSNMFKMLVNGGECLSVFMAACPIYTLFETLSKDEKWAPYMSNVEKMISPYFHSDDPQNELKSLLENVGFSVEDCFSKTTSHTFPDLNSLCDSVKAVDPFMERIPKNLQELYLLDCQSIIKSKHLCVVCEKTGQATCSYTLLIVYSSKSKNQL